MTSILQDKFILSEEQEHSTKVLVVAATTISAGHEIYSRGRRPPGPHTQSVERVIQLIEVAEVTVIVCDYQLEDGTCFDLLKALKEENPTTPRLPFTSSATPVKATSVLKPSTSER